MEARVARVVTAITGVFLVAVALAALVAPRPPFTVYRQPVVIGVALALVVVAVFWRAPAWLRRGAGSRWAPPVVAVLGGWVGVVVGTSLVFPWSWDVGVLHTVARRLFLGEALSDRQVDYLSRYPNTHVLLDVHRTGFWVEERTGWPAVTVLVSLVGVAAGLTVLLVHPLVAPVGGRVRAVAAQLVVVALVATSPWMALPYSDVLAMPLVTGAVLLALRAFTRDLPGALALVLSAALTGVAIALKATPVVLVVAVAVVGVVLAVDRWRRWPEALAVLGGTLAWVALVLGTLTGVTTAATASIGPVVVRADAAPPGLWWVANGMTPTTTPPNPTRYGGYNGVMLEAIREMDQPTATQWSADWIRARWVHDGLGGLTAFYADKAVWNWGDGMFWAWGEGRDGRPETLPPVHDGVAGVVHDVDGRFGASYPLRSDLAQGLWLAVVFVGGVGALRRRGPPRDVVLVALTVLGIAAFTLVFQGRSRYLFTYVPLVVALAAYAPRGPRLRVPLRLSPFRRSDATPS